MPPQSTAALVIVLLFMILPSFEAKYVSKHLRDTLLAIPSAYQGVAVHHIHEIHSLADVTDGGKNSEDKAKAIGRRRRRRCKGVVCENGGTIIIRRSQCVCSCPQGYVGYNCQYRGNCKLSDYTDCFLKQTHADLTTGYWALKFQHHFLAARAKYSKKIRVVSEELYLGKPYKLTISYTQKARHKHHRPKAENMLTVVWKKQYKKPKVLFKENFGRFEGITGSKCVNLPRGFGEIRITFHCWNPYHCNIVPPHDTHYIKKKNTSFFLDGVNLEQGKC